MGPEDDANNNDILPSTHWVPHPILSASYLLTYFILMRASSFSNDKRYHHHSHCINEETKAQRDQVTCPKAKASKWQRKPKLHHQALRPCSCILLTPVLPARLGAAQEMERGSRARRLVPDSQAWKSSSWPG